MEHEPQQNACDKNGQKWPCCKKGVQVAGDGGGCEGEPCGLCEPQLAAAPEIEPPEEGYPLCRSDKAGEDAVLKGEMEGPVEAEAAVFDSRAQGWYQAVPDALAVCAVVVAVDAEQVVLLASYLLDIEDGLDEGVGGGGDGDLKVGGVCRKKNPHIRKEGAEVEGVAAPRIGAVRDEHSLFDQNTVCDGVYRPANKDEGKSCKQKKRLGLGQKEEEKQCYSAGAGALTTQHAELLHFWLANNNRARCGVNKFTHPASLSIPFSWSPRSAR